MSMVREETETSARPWTRLEIVTDLTSLELLSSEWDDLVSRSSGTIFQTFDWQSLWWKHFASGPRHSLYVMTLRENERLIGIAPFFVESFTFAGLRIFKQLRLIGSGLQSEKTPVLSLERDGPGDYLDVIAERGYEEKVGTSVAEFVTRTPHDWDEIEFQNLPEGGIILTHVLPRIQSSNFEVVKHPTDICPRILLPNTVDEYLASLRSGFRRNIRRSFNTYFTDNQFDVEDLRNEGDVNDALNTLSILHQKRWNVTGYPGLFSDSRFETLQRNLVKLLSEKGRLWLTILRHRGKPVAARLLYAFNGQVWDYLSGFEVNRGSGSPRFSGAGMALMFYAIKRSIESGFEVFELARGDESYKFDLTSTFTRNYRVTIQGRSRRRQWRHIAHRVRSAQYSIISRFACESAILNVIAKENGFFPSLPAYLSHLRGRLYRNRLGSVQVAAANQRRPSLETAFSRRKGSGPDA
jgi:CelD/BcsL family acetyltransferase involved in cellulose biosynthesis